MWFATQDGLNRFDGSNFLVFPVSFDDVTTIDNVLLGKLLANDEEILMISSGGKIQIFNLLTQTISPYNFPGMPAQNHPPASSIFIDKDEGLWIGTIRDGAFHIDKKNSIRRFTSESSDAEKIFSNSVRSFFQEKDGIIWILSDEGAIELKGNIAKGHLEGIDTNVLVEGPEKSLWLGTLGNGIFYKNGNTEFESFKGFGSQTFPKNLVIEAMLVDDQNRIWAGTFGNGLYIIDPSAEIVHHLLPDRQDPFSSTYLLGNLLP